MSFETEKNKKFLMETAERSLFPKNLNEEQKAKFRELVLDDLQGKARTGRHETEEYQPPQDFQNKLVTKAGQIHSVDWVVVVATKVEYEACISYLRNICMEEWKVNVGTSSHGGLLFRCAFEEDGGRLVRKIFLQRTLEQGANSSSNLVQNICKLEPKPTSCFLVGSCGAIPTKKLKLLDVIVPKVALDGQKFSVDRGKVILEAGSSFERHMRISEIASSLETWEYGLPDGSDIETDKQLITSSGKWDSLGHDVVQALLQGAENVVAVEMEGVGFADGLKVSQQNNSNIILGISKGAADYCSTEEISEEQLTHLRSVWPEILDTSVKPTADLGMKKKLQVEAIQRALQVALKFFREVDG